MAIRVDAIQKTRRIARAERVDAISVGLALIRDHLENLFLELFRGLRFGALQEQHAETRRREGTWGGAAVAIRSGEVAYGLAAEQIVAEHAAFDDVDRFSFHAFVVDVIAANQAMTLEIFQSWVVDDGEKTGQHAGLVAGCKCADGAVRSAGLRLAAHDVRAYERGDHVIRRIRCEKNGPAIFFLDD